MTLFRNINPYCRFTVPIFDTVHVLNNAVKAALHEGYGDNIRKALIALRSPFATSMKNLMR